MKKLFTLAIAFITLQGANAQTTISIDSLIQRKIDSTFKAQTDSLRGSANITFTRNGKVVTADVSTAISGAPAVATKASSDVAAMQKTIDALLLRIQSLEAINIKVKAAYQ